MKILKCLIPVSIIYIVLASCLKDKNAGENILIENKEYSLVLGKNGRSMSLKHKVTGQECLQQGINLPVFALTQDRPYDNELQLSYPSKPRTFGSDTLYWENGDLIAGFRPERNRARIGVKITDSYIAFTLKGFEYDYDDFRVKRKTEIDEFTILQLPVRDRSYFGEWLNASWDDNIAVNILGATPETKVDAVEREGYHIMNAGAVASVQMEGTGAVLIVTDKQNLLTDVRSAEEDFGMPSGVKSRMSEEYKYSYYEAVKIDPSNVDKHIAFAKQGGFRALMVHYFAFSGSLGHFPWLSQYPGGIEDLKAVVKKISDAGMVPGIHIHYSKVMKNDPYVTPVPDARLNLARIFTLSGDLDRKTDVIPVEENPRGSTLEGARCFLKLGNELIEYTGYTTERPYCFTGCKRAALGTTSKEYKAGLKFGLLDVDTWTIFVRIDQNTSLQQEIAERLCTICNEAGFRFVYFDGAEDVHPPYWYNIARSQYEVYKRLVPEILFAEGAAKAHFSWHMLTRGNAFDTFRPEIIKEAVKRYQLPEARLVANDFSAINFGWVNPFIPDNKTIGMQPDMIEYVWSRAAAWDCPVSLNGNLELLDSHPRSADNLEAIRRWEKARIEGFFTEEMKNELRDPDQEHTLLIDEQGNFELQACSQLTGYPVDSSEIRSFMFERNGKRWIAYWNSRGNSEIKLYINPSDISLYSEPGKEVNFRTENSGTVILPLSGRHYLVTSLGRDKIAEAFRNMK